MTQYIGPFTFTLPFGRGGDVKAEFRIEEDQDFPDDLFLDLYGYEEGEEYGIINLNRQQVRELKNALENWLIK